MDIGRVARDATISINESIFSNLFINPIYVACIITLTVMIIVISMYDEEHYVKTGFYILCSTIGIIFIHNKLLIMENKKDRIGGDSSLIVNTMGGADYTVPSSEASQLDYLTM